MSLQTTLRPIPTISADGAIVSAGSEDNAGGEILSQRHGGTDVLYGFSAEEILAACTPLPERLLLGYARQTGEDRRKSALARAIAEGLVALLPALFIMAALRYITDNRPVTLTGFVLIMLVVMGRAAWRELRTPGKVWQLTEWLDFGSRTWQARKASPDNSLPTRTANLPLDELVLVCLDQHWEQRVTHDLALCRADEFEGLDKYAEAPRLNMLHQAEREEDCIALARQLGQCWKIPAFRYAFDVAAQRNRLFGLDEPPPNQKRSKTSPTA